MSIRDIQSLATHGRNAQIAPISRRRGQKVKSTQSLVGVRHVATAPPA